MNVLRRLETDGTYNQNAQVERILIESFGHACYSFDLSSATDRFPVEIQERLLSTIFTPEIAQLWRTILTARAYSTCDNKHYRWKVGQPLGLLSSWAVFSLTHHAVIEYCALKEGLPSFRQYAVLGDDVVIWNSSVASAYEKLMKVIGVEINYSKSLVGTDRVHRVEFAKRILFKGQEISGVKPGVLIQADKHISMFPSMIQVLQEHNWNLPWAEISPPHLSVNKRRALAILLWDYLGVMPTIEGGHISSQDISLETLRKQTLMFRIDSLKEKQERLDKILDKALPIEDLFKKEGIDVSDRLIGLEGYGGSLHPVVWAINQTGEEMAISLSIMEDILHSEDAEIPSELPIEYLPVPSMMAYFGDRHDLREQFHTRMVLKAWKKLCSQD